MLKKTILFALLLLLLTPWLIAQKALPYSYGFENDNLAGEGWTRINNYQNNSSIIPYVYHNGSFAFKFSYPQDNSSPQYLISPRLVMPANVSNIKVSLWYNTRGYGYTEKFKVGYSTTDNSPSSFTWDTEVSTATTTWQYYETSITIPVTTKYIAIAETNTDALYIDDIYFDCYFNGSSFIAYDGAIPFITDYSYSFGLAPERTTHTFTFDNPGTVASSISVTHTGDFDVSLQNSTIPAKGSTTLTVTMPDASGSDVITISSTNGIFNDFDINVSGIVRYEDKLYQNGFSSLPTGWTTTGSWNYTANDGANPNSGNPFNPSYDGQLITPRLYIAEGEKFYVEAKGKSSYNTLKLQYSADGSSWTDIATESNIDQTNWNIFEFTGAPAGGYYIAIYSNRANIRMYYGGRVFDKTFQDDGDWNDGWSGGAPTSSDYVCIDATCTIPNGTEAVANHIALGTNGSITIEDGGQLVCNNAVEATMKKEITQWTTVNEKAANWFFIASPVADGTTPSTENGILTDNPDNYDLYYYNNPLNMWINYKDDGDPNTPNDDPGFENDGGMLLNGKGYLYANHEDVTLEFTGGLKPYAATETVDVVEGWNLIGNPFAYEVYVDHDYYQMNDDGSGFDPIEKGNRIMPCTGILVEAENAGVVTFSTELMVSSANKGNIQITLAHAIASRDGTSTSSATIDNAIVSFNENAKLEKFHFGSQAANIYIPQNHKEYAIVSAEKQGEMPLSFVANEIGEYTITVKAKNVGMSHLHLIDNKTGADVDLLTTPSYTFNGYTTDYASRFRLVFSANENENDDFAFIGSDGQLIVNATGIIQIIDLLGRVISTKSTEERINTNEMTPGVYVLQLITGSDLKTQKIVIR